MNHRQSLAFVLLLAVAACQGKLPETPKPGPASKAPGTTAASAKPVPPQLLQTAGEGVELSGQVMLDAGYATAHGAQAVGGALGLDGARVISNDGASLVNAAGQIVAQGGGNVIVPAGLITNDGASLITNDGGSLITNDGGSLITNDGASIVAQGGGNIVAQGGGNFRLAQAADQGRPAAGMWISVLDLQSGLALDLGKDAAGKPVKAIYSDATGHFKVRLPAGVAKNVRVVARAPGTTDPRLNLHVVTAAKGGGDRPVDAVNAVATAYLRYVIAVKMLQLITVDPQVVAGYFARLQNKGKSTSGLDALLVGPLQVIKDAFKAVHAEKLPPQRQLELCVLASDRLLANVDLASIELNYAIYQPLVDKPEAVKGKPAFAMLTDSLYQTLLKAEDLAGGPDKVASFFATKPYVRAANLRRPACSPYTFLQPVDVPDFLIHEYLLPTDDRTLDVMDHIFYDLDVPAVERDHLRGAGVSIFVALAQQMYASTDAGPVVEDMAAQILGAGEKFNNAPRPTPVPGATCVPPAAQGPTPDPVGTVSTVAGAAEPGRADGPGATARFNLPYGIVADPKAMPPVLYVSDFNNHTIRRLVMDAAGNATVETLALPVDAFAAPRGLGMGPDGSLYVADAGQRVVRRVSFAANGSPSVATVAGPDPGLLEPTALAVAPGGKRLVVGDQKGGGLWQVALDGSSPALSRLTKGGDGDLDAAHAQDALVGAPTGLTFGPDGTLYLGQSSGYVRKIAGPAGVADRTSFIAGFGDRPTEPFDGFWSNAIFHYPAGMQLDAKGRLVIANTLGHRIRALTLDGWASTLAGGGPTGEEGSFADGAADKARFSQPLGLTIAPDGMIYVVDSRNNRIRKLAP